MQIKIRNYKEPLFFQEGGAIAPEQGGDPLAQIIEAAAQAVQQQDGNLALQVCQALVELAQSSAEPPAEAAPEAAPVYRAGGKLSRWIKK